MGAALKGKHKPRVDSYVSINRACIPGQSGRSSTPLRRHISQTYTYIHIY